MRKKSHTEGEQVRTIMNRQVKTTVPGKRGKVSNRCIWKVGSVME